MKIDVIFNRGVRSTDGYFLHFTPLLIQFKLNCTSALSLHVETFSLMYMYVMFCPISTLLLVHASVLTLYTLQFSIRIVVQ